MLNGYRGDLFFLYPKPGDGNSIWRPSWNQVMTDKLPSTDRDRCYEDVEWDEEKGAYRCSQPVRCIERGYIRELAVEGPQERPRSGELEVKDADMTPHVFKIAASHRYPIPDGSYTLLGPKRFQMCWVVGRRLPDDRFEKVSVVTGERQRLKRFGGARELVQYLA
ncbi:hypothetical protein ARMGADRAFT_722642 [Armillaria gallica]|uniref:Uncharacterized protein n=1 Tax=Armillaria gallica TaxID=47427 RepID=A0A2H3DSC1_ARMGA|nr:hypothetical protein ARMGADRAFT_722642 [Armillaria gallica]